MEGFKEIEIKRYRGIESLEINDFSRVNIFLGQNNSGKSSILEAIMLLTGMSNPNLPQRINNIRSRSFFSTLKDLSYMFYNLDINKAPYLYAYQSDGLQRALNLKISYKYTDNNDNGEIEEMQVASSESKSFFNAIEMDFAISKTISDLDVYHYNNFIVFNSSGAIVNSKYSNDYIEKYRASYISPDLSVSYLSEDLSVLIRKKQKDLIIDRMQVFDHRINAVESIGNEVYIGFEGVNELLPLSMSGDGLRRYLSVVISSANPENNIILIDEIDNGIHYSAYGKLWQSIFDLAHKTDKQVFVTTHSKETLVQLYNMLRNNISYQKDFRLYTVEKTANKGHKAYKYLFEEFEDACMNNVELRSVVL